MLIKAENVTKKYGNTCVLDAASMEIGEGEIVGLFGKSGIGKSTFSKILCGVVKPESGDLEINAGIQMIYQQPWSSLDPQQKIGKGFEELIRYHGFAEGKENVRKLMLESLQAVGLNEEVLGHLPHQISGGEAQRVAIARALLFKPDLLIMDEATSMLDVLTQAGIMKLVRENVVKRGGSVLLISHDRALTKHVCDRIYTMENGKFISEG